MKNKYETTLVIGDSHADPRFSNDRFTALGNYVVDRRPSNVIDMGDFGNLDSISFHDRGKPLLQEGMRLSDDIAAMRDAHNRIESPLNKLNNTFSKWKKRQYSPRKIKLLGNHEDRVWRYLCEKPELVGFIPHNDFVGAVDDGWSIHPYRDYVYISGVAFTHIPMHPAGNRPIGGKYVAQRVVEGQDQTTVFGHTHTRNLHSTKRNNANGGTVIEGIGAGCYFDYNPDYVRGNEGQLNWWRGLLVLTHVAPGEVDVEYISINRIKDEYL